MKLLVRLLIRGYQWFISPVIHAIGGSGTGCRFTPTCSHYFLEAVETHGFWAGSCMGIKRLLRCNPWGGSGHDPVPHKSGDPNGLEITKAQQDSHTTAHCTCHSPASGHLSSPPKSAASVEDPPNQP